MLFWADYYLRWWRLPIEERACRKTDLGVGDYYLRNSGLPPSSQEVNILIRNFTNPRWTSNIRYFFYSFLKPLGVPPPPKKNHHQNQKMPVTAMDMKSPLVEQSL